MISSIPNFEVGGKLPPCLMTMQRKNRTYGYFSGERWTSYDGTAVIDNGNLLLPTGPGWGADVNEDFVRPHPPRR
jgi:L-alanine-DL-glutamate epimerase-like enolase superfamily enzyme